MSRNKLILLKHYVILVEPFINLSVFQKKKGQGIVSTRRLCCQQHCHGLHAKDTIITDKG